ncbi:MAG: formate dehydrogenase accessory protein FdhE [Candidatus Zixiibacteriota bacterium]
MKAEVKILEELYKEFKKAKAEAQKNYKEEKIKIDRAEVEKRIKRSDYLLDFKDIEMDPKWLEGLFKEYLSILRKFKKDDGKFVEKLEQSCEKKELDLEVLIKKVFCFDSEYLENLAKKLKVDAEDLNFLGLHLGNPVFELYAQRVMEKIDRENWLKGFCPVCGSLPAMAYLRKDDGKRILWCKFCETQWSYLRLKCPFCSNEDQKTLRYFFTAEGDPHRVYVCDECKKYVKTIDQRKMEKPQDLDLGWENLNSLALDLVAEKEGYFNPYSQSLGQEKGMVT